MSKTNKGDATASFVWQYRGQLCGHMRIAPWGLFQLQKAFRRSSQKKGGGKSPLPFCFAAIDLLQDGRAEGRVRAKWTTALQGLRELVGLAEILQCVRIVDAVVKAALARREPGVNAKRSAVGGAGESDFSLAALITDRPGSFGALKKRGGVYHRDG
jgi:hypothetical protein